MNRIETIISLAADVEGQIHIDTDTGYCTICGSPDYIGRVAVWTLAPEEVSAIIATGQVAEIA